ncbi:MAG TPA: hypothetical protein VMH36_00570 [Alphaproteobacteria bacterium]|nr:hypothetical protein [Alphaproteobacteria bacterium]
MTRAAIIAAAVLALVAGDTGYAASVRDQPWPASQEGLGLDADGFDSWADAHAVLPAKVKVAPPATGASKTVKEYSGIWNGWICAHRSTDLKVAFINVGPKAATATVAWAETDAARGTATWPLKLVGDEFRSQGADVLYKFRLRAFDDVRAGLPVMDVMRIQSDGSVCSGILRKESAK